MGLEPYIKQYKRQVEAGAPVRVVSHPDVPGQRNPPALIRSAGLKISLPANVVI